MNRARLLGTLLGLILLACAAAVYLDQQGAFGGRSADSPAAPVSTDSPGPTTAPASGGDGYGDLK